MSNASPDIRFSQYASYPKSAPQKGDGEEKTVYGMSIPYLNHEEDYEKKKRVQNFAYFQEFTRQNQEKPGERTQDKNEKSAEDKTISFERPTPSRYLKKHEIENHTKLARHHEQPFGGVLQRDEAAINQLKKIEQQKEMQSFLNRQMQEKKLRNERIKQERLDLNVFQDKNQDLTDSSQLSPIIKLHESATIQEPVLIPEVFSQSLVKSNTLTSENSELASSKLRYDQIIREKEELSNNVEIKSIKLKDQEENPLKAKPCPQRSQINPSKFQKRGHKNDYTSKPSEGHRAIISKSPVIIKSSQYSRNQPIQTSCNRSPVPKTPETELESVRTMKEVEASRHNLDTAGKSCFIYPDSQGNFADEIDKFLIDFEKRENQKYRNSYNHPTGNEKFSSSSISFAPRKSDKPLMVYRAGFPNDFFWGTAKK